jgi:hypothetical protein
MAPLVLEMENRFSWFPSEIAYVRTVPASGSLPGIVASTIVFSAAFSGRDREWDDGLGASFTSVTEM